MIFVMAQEQVAIRARHVDVTMLNAFAILYSGRGKQTGAGEQLGENALRVRREMPDHKDRREIGRQ